MSIGDPDISDDCIHSGENMGRIEDFSAQDRKIIAAAATWGRVVEREGYGDAGFPIDPSVVGRFDGGPGIPQKSALFQRLLSGKAPLVYRPPLSHSYPWYAVIEGEQKEHRVSVCVIPPGSQDWPGLDNTRPHVVINQAVWRVEEEVKPGEEYIVGWGSYPMTWRVARKRVTTGTVAEKLSARAAAVRARFSSGKVDRHDAYSARIVVNLRKLKSLPAETRLSEDEIEVLVQDSVQSLERMLRDPDHPNLQIDAEGHCWSDEWTLMRIGLPGWPFAGTVLPPEPESGLETIKFDEEGVMVYFKPDEDTDDPSGVAWLRIERDAETRIARYLGASVSARSRLVAAVEADYSALFTKGMGLDRISVMDRSEVSGKVSGRYFTSARPESFSRRVK